MQNPDDSSTAAANTRAGRQVRDRQVPDTAGPRCLCYAACSELVASPHEVDPRPALAERFAVADGVPHADGLGPVLRELSAAELEQLRAQYSGLFEVGSQGPPVPIREDLQTGQHGGTREEIVRFYDYFGYVLDGKFAWQPDHLSVELEFMHFLCYREAQAATADDALSFQLAQADFARRHLVNWLPPFAANVEKVAGGTLYARVVAAIRDFVVADLDWQRGTIVETADDRPADGRGAAAAAP